MYGGEDVGGGDDDDDNDGGYDGGDGGGGSELTPSYQPRKRRFQWPCRKTDRHKHRHSIA